MNVKKKTVFKIATLVLVFVLLLAADLATKFYICNITSTGERIFFIKGVIEFTYSENTGASFGIMGQNTTLLTVFSCVAAALIAGYLIYAKNAHFLLQLSLTMFVSGAVGNIYDRIKFGYVRDFIDYTLTDTLFGYQFAICNFADAVLVIACIMLIIYVLFFYSKHYDKTHPAQEARQAAFLQDVSAEQEIVQEDAPDAKTLTKDDIEQPTHTDEADVLKNTDDKTE